MYYAVNARFNVDQSGEFLRLLTDGSIEQQKPDGKEIADSMRRAKIDASGIVRWSEVCYCATPLAHERATVYDDFFAEMQTEEVADYVEFEGDDFMDFLACSSSNDD